jgi:hypothetical protein
MVGLGSVDNITMQQTSFSYCSIALDTKAIIFPTLQERFLGVIMVGLGNVDNTRSDANKPVSSAQPL